MCERAIRTMQILSRMLIQSSTVDDMQCQGSNSMHSDILMPILISVMRDLSSRLVVLDMKANDSTSQSHRTARNP